MLQDVIAHMKAKGHKVFEDGPYNLNIVGLRNKCVREAGSFDDLLLLFWKYNGVWSSVLIPCTTDPGAYYLENPLNEKGTAIVKEGQYENVMGLGKHKGEYEAVVQTGPITVYRDPDRDTVLDTDVEEETGIFGINIHKAEVSSYEDRIRRWSAGCTVMPEKHFEVFMSICRAAVKEWGNSLTYTVLEWNW